MGGRGSGGTGQGLPMDPLTLLVGAAILAMGLLAGHLSGRRTERRRQDRPREPICGCTHHRSMHANGGKGECMAAVGRPEAWAKDGKYLGRQPVGCARQQYVGPVPVNEIWVPPAAVESGDR